MNRAKKECQKKIKSLFSKKCRRPPEHTNKITTRVFYLRQTFKQPTSERERNKSF